MNPLPSHNGPTLSSGASTLSPGGAGRGASPAGVRLLAMDADGVLTDGSIFLDDHGREIKRFNVRDGLGVAAWLKLGFDAAVITRRSGAALEHRMKELGVTRLVQGARDKAAAVAELAHQAGLPLAHVAFIGDDWPDLPALRAVGYPCAVGDADPAVKRAAVFIARAPGGRGAVREVIEHLLNAKGLLSRAISLYSETSTDPAESRHP